MTKVVAPILTILKRQRINDGETTTEKLTGEAGDVITYFVDVGNASNATSAAFDVTVTDAVPKGLIYVKNSADNGGTYDAMTNTLTWKLGTLEIGGTKTVTFKALIPSTAYNTNYLNVGVVTASNAPKRESRVEEDTPDKQKITIHYVDTAGKPIADDFTAESKKDTPYDVVGKLYPSIKNGDSTYTKVGTGTFGKYDTTDGITNDSDPVKGTLDSDKVLWVVYDIPNAPDVEKQKITIHYVDTTGKPISDDVTSTGSKGDSYSVTDKIYPVISKSSTTYEKVGTGHFGQYDTTDGITNNSDPTQGTLDDDKELWVVYDVPKAPAPAPEQQKVIIHYVDTEGKPIAGDAITSGGKGSGYDVSGKIYPSISKDGQPYHKVGTGTFGKYDTTDGITNDSDPTQGTLDGEKELWVVYDVPKAPAPDTENRKVMIHYVDTEGNQLTEDATTSGEQGSGYDVTDKVYPVVTKGGKSYLKVGTGTFGKYDTTNGITKNSDPTQGTLDSDKEIWIVYKLRDTGSGNPEDPMESNPVEVVVGAPKLVITKQVDKKTLQQSDVAKKPRQTHE